MDKEKLKSKRVLITGGNGFLGTYLKAELEKYGAIVFSFSLGEANTANSFNIDITDYKAVKEVVDVIKPEIIFHMAAFITRERDFKHMKRMEEINVEGTNNLLMALKEYDYSSLIYPSTSEVYGNEFSPCSENQFPQPVSPYSLTKLSAEYLIQTFSKIYNKSYTILRIFLPYGKGMPESFFIPQIVNTIKQNKIFEMTLGDQMRDFIHVDDVIDALIMSANNPRANREIFNVCTGVGIKLNELARLINRQINGSLDNIKIGALKYRDNEIWDLRGDNSKIKEVLGFTPKVSLDNGIHRLIND